MNCRTCRPRLVDALDQPDLEVAAHLRDCPACRAEWGRLRRVTWLLESDPAPPTEDLRAAVWARLERLPSHQPSALGGVWQQAVPALLGVLLLVGFTAGYALWRWPVAWPDWVGLGRAAEQQAFGWLDLLGATLSGLGELLVTGLAGLRLTGLPDLPGSLLLGSAVAAVAAELLTRRAAPLPVRNTARGG